MVGAMNQVEYLGSQVCGACVSVTGPKGAIVVRIVDRCPECLKGHIDLSKEAFAKLADLALGVVPVTWKFVPCSVTGPIRYKFKEGSNQWWTAIQVRNIRYAVVKLEAKKSGSWVSINRETYNYFVLSSGLGVGPYELRVTDVLGHVLTDAGIPFKEGQEVPGAAQFPP
jgi:expansin (peptidoglycan-binding protein)